MMITRVCFERVMAHMWICGGTHVNDSWNTREWVTTHMEMSHAHIWMRHGTHVNNSSEYAISHIRLSHITRARMYCGRGGAISYSWVMVNMLVSNGKHINEKLHTCEWFIAHMWMSSWHTCEWVMNTREWVIAHTCGSHVIYTCTAGEVEQWLGLDVVAVVLTHFLRVALRICVMAHMETSHSTSACDLTRHPHQQDTKSGSLAIVCLSSVYVCR